MSSSSSSEDEEEKLKLLEAVGSANTHIETIGATTSLEKEKKVPSNRPIYQDNGERTNILDISTDQMKHVGRLLDDWLESVLQDSASSESGDINSTKYIQDTGIRLIAGGTVLCGDETANTKPPCRVKKKRPSISSSSEDSDEEMERLRAAAVSSESIFKGSIISIPPNDNSKSDGVEGDAWISTPTTNLDKNSEKSNSNVIESRAERGDHVISKKKKKKTKESVGSVELSDNVIGNDAEIPIENGEKSSSVQIIAQIDNNEKLQKDGTEDSLDIENPIILKKKKKKKKRHLENEDIVDSLLDKPVQRTVLEEQSLNSLPKKKKKKEKNKLVEAT